MKRTGCRASGSGALLAALVFGCLIACLLESTAVAGEFMLMPTASIVQRTGSVDDPTVEKRSILADLFYAGDVGRLRLLGELQLERDGVDMERLQAGWRLTPDTSLWFGRYHNPIGYWNLEHHHGHYIETSAERPRILEFEDEGGPLPIHLAGFLLQGVQPMGAASLQYDLGAATGPRVTDEGLEAVDVLRNPRRNKLAMVARLAWRPDAALDDQYGAFAARTRIPIVAGDPATIEQDLWGVYLNREFSRWRLFGELFQVRHRTVEGGIQWPSYWAGYIQAEYKVVPSVWTVFARHEGLSSRLTESYSALFPRLTKERQVAGLRWDFFDNQALKLELIRDTVPAGATYNGIELQWSAMFH